MTDKITIQMASIPTRKETMIRAVMSLADQCDAMNVILNNYSYHFGHKNVRFLSWDNTLEDGSKFLGVENIEGYVLVCDDDILYPRNYVSEMVRTLHEDYNDSVILGIMGKNLKPRPLQSYYKDLVDSFQTFDTLQEDKEVEIPGTNAMIYHTNYFKCSINDMKVPNSDVCVGVAAKKQGVKCFVKAHEHNWLQNMMPDLPIDTPSIYEKYRNNDFVITDFINKNM